MTDNSSDIEKFKEGHEENERRRAEIKEIVGIPFEKHALRYAQNSERSGKYLDSIASAQRAGNDSAVMEYTIQYMYLRAQQDQSISKFNFYQQISIYVDKLYDILEDGLVLQALSALGVQGMEKAVEAKKEASKNVWDIEEKRKEVETSLRIMFEKMDHDNEDYDQTGPQGDSGRVLYQKEIDDYINRSDDNPPLPLGKAAD
jgi:hypothetical protein